nr:hypothetical protein [uncultured Carboxylicivirga sp.]
MTALNINLLYQAKKKYWVVALGVILISTALASLFFRSSLQPWMVLQGIFFFIYGSYLTSLGLGYNPEGLLGKAYIDINSEYINYKPEVIKKALFIKWADVAAIEVKQISILFTLKDNSTTELKYYNLEYEHIQHLKSAIKKYGADKNLSFL